MLDVLDKIMPAESIKNEFYQSLIETPLGPMVVIADKNGLYLLEFVDWHGLEHTIKNLCLKTEAMIITGSADPILSIGDELSSYFGGSLQEFKTPLRPIGTPFQKLAWSGLMRVPYGQTRSYRDQATSIGKPTATRAVANANGANPIAIVIPCHRIINSNGDLGGYGGGIARKKWLINHEKQHGS